MKQAEFPALKFRYQSVVLSLLIGLSLTVYVYFQAYRLESEVLLAQVKNYTQDMRRTIEADAEKNLSTLSALRSFFAASRTVEAPEFAIFTEHLFNLYPTIETLEWAPRVLNEDVPVFRIAARRAGVREPALYRFSESGTPIPAEDKKEYFPTLYAEPFETSASVIGYDHMSDPGRAAAMHRAADADAIIATGILKIYRADQNKPEPFRGFVAYLPVFASDASRRHSPRPAQLLKGYLAAVLRVDEFVRASVGRFHSGDIAVSVFAADVANPGAWVELIRSGGSASGTPYLGRIGPIEHFVHQAEFDLAGQRWKIECERTEGPYDAGHRTSSALLAVGILGSILLALVMILIERRKAQALVTEWSVRDELTGLYNRRGFLLFGEERIRLAQRNRAGLQLLCADLDYLKRINDTHGHAAGDRVLIRAGKILKDALRESDIVARIGGDEFAALVQESEAEGVEGILARIHAAIREDAAAHMKGLEVSLSIGAASMKPEEAVTLNELLRQADQELYRAKAARPPHDRHPKHQ